MSLRQTIYRKLDKPKYKAKLINGWQNTQNIVDAIAVQHAINMDDAKKICQYFKGKDERETAKNIFNFLKSEIEYKVEPASRQTTKTMARFLADGNGDCKHFALFSNTILQACGYKPKYRLAGYRSAKDFQHIYSYLPKSNTILDAVLPTFDTEKTPKIKKDYDMSLYQLSGTEDISEINGINFSKVKENVKKGGAAAVKKAVAEIPAAAKKIQQGMATAGLAIPRNAFLELVNLNFSGLASNFNELITAKGDDGIKWWVDLGGDRTAFVNAVNNGKAKKRLLGVQEETEAFNEVYGGYSGDGVYIGVVVTTAAATAAPVLIKAADILKKAQTTASKSKPILDAAKKATAKFKSVTGKDVKDVIFKKEAGKISTKTEITSADLQPTTSETATKVAKAAVENATSDSGTYKPDDKTNPKPTNAMQWIKDNKFIVIGGVAGIGLLGYFLTRKKTKKAN